MTYNKLGPYILVHYGIHIMASAFPKDNASHVAYLTVVLLFNILDYIMFL